MIAMPRAGTHSLGPANGTVLVHTKREGMAARMGHDLTLEATRWEGTAVVDGEDVGNNALQFCRATHRREHECVREHRVCYIERRTGRHDRDRRVLGLAEPGP